jgi:hypothetical protein
MKQKIIAISQLLTLQANFSYKSENGKVTEGDTT